VLFENRDLAQACGRALFRGLGVWRGAILRRLIAGHRGNSSDAALGWTLSRSSYNRVEVDVDDDY
jgi:hypothetical protein